jgi:hypothetical protein
MHSAVDLMLGFWAMEVGEVGRTVSVKDVEGKDCHCDVGVIWCDNLMG